MTSFEPLAMPGGAAGWVHWTDARGRDRRSMVVTATFDLVHGGVATIAPAAMDVAVEDRTPWKAYADVIVRGEAHASAGKRALVRVAIARGPHVLFTKESVVPHGDRIPWGGREGPWASPLTVDDATPPSQFQLAPDDQRIDELWGGEQILMSDASPARETMHFRLPAITPHVQSGDVSLPVSLDTMRLDLRDGRCTLTWRAVVPPDQEPASVRIVWLPLLEVEEVEGAPRAWILGRPPLLPVGERERVPLLNTTRFEAVSMTWCRSAGAWAHTIIVKGTFDVGDAGEITMADEPVAIAGDEVAVGDVATGAHGLLRATDIVPFKPEPEVLVVGTAHAPPNQDVALVRLTLGDVSKRVVAVGPRQWAADGTPGTAGPFTPVPLHHGMAFGGPGYDANPVGMGQGTEALPCLENPDALIRRRGAAVAPACFAPIPISWKARSVYAKDVDAKAQRAAAPALPKGLDLRIFQSAPADQRSRARASAGSWLGDEAFELTAVVPGGGKLAGRLPSAAPLLYARRPDGNITNVAARLDTVTIDADARQLQLVWRAVLAIADEDASDVVEILVGDGSLGATPDIDGAWATMRSRRDPRFPRLAGVPATSARVPWVTAPSAAMRTGDAELPPTPSLEPPTRRQVVAWIESDSLAERDLSGADLHGLDFTQKNLTGARLDGTTLDGARFDEATLCDASLADAHGSGTSWRGADLSRVDATRIVLTDADLTMAVLSGATFEASILTDVHCDEVQASSLQLGSATLTDASFERATLDGSTWSRSTCERLVIRGADLTGSKWLASRVRDVDGEGAVLAKAQLDDAVWEGAKLVDLRATASSWEGAVMAGAVFVGAELTRASLSRVDLSGADLSRANLVLARLDKAIVRGAKLCAANLMQAMLERTDFTAADATGANLFQANLRGAQLEGTRLEQAHVAGTLLAPAPREPKA